MSFKDYPRKKQASFPFPKLDLPESHHYIKIYCRDFDGKKTTIIPKKTAAVEEEEDEPMDYQSLFAAKKEKISLKSEGSTLLDDMRIKAKPLSGKKVGLLCYKSDREKWKAKAEQLGAAAVWPEEDNKFDLLIADDKYPLFHDQVGQYKQVVAFEWLLECESKRAEVAIDNYDLKRFAAWMEERENDTDSASEAELAEMNQLL